MNINDIIYSGALIDYDQISIDVICPHCKHKIKKSLSYAIPLSTLLNLNEAEIHGIQKKDVQQGVLFLKEENRLQKIKTNFPLIINNQSNNPYNTPYAIEVIPCYCHQRNTHYAIIIGTKEIQNGKISIIYAGLMI